MENENVNTTEETCTCYKCGHTYNKKDMKVYKIQDRDYGSQFAWIDAEIPLCKECQKDIEEDWFDENAIIVNEDIFNQYIYYGEEDLFDFICSFPLKYQEKIFNQGFAYGKKDKISAEEWIKEQKKILASLYGRKLELL